MSLAKIHLLRRKTELTLFDQTTEPRFWPKKEGVFGVTQRAVIFVLTTVPRAKVVTHR